MCTVQWHMQNTEQFYTMGLVWILDIVKMLRSSETLQVTSVLFFARSSRLNETTGAVFCLWDWVWYLWCSCFLHVAYCSLISKNKLLICQRCQQWCLNKKWIHEKGSEIWISCNTLNITLQGYSGWWDVHLSCADCFQNSRKWAISRSHTSAGLTVLWRRTHPKVSHIKLTTTPRDPRTALISLY